MSKKHDVSSLARHRQAPGDSHSVKSEVVVHPFWIDGVGVWLSPKNPWNKPFVHVLQTLVFSTDSIESVELNAVDQVCTFSTHESFLRRSSINAILSDSLVRWTV